MGNQNTSGMAEKEAKNEAADNVQGVTPPNAVTVVENQTLGEENAAEAEADKIPHVERQASDDKDIEDDKGSFEGSDAVNGSEFWEGRSKFSDEEQDQPCTLTGEMQNHEAVNATPSDIQEEQNVMVEEVDDHDAKKNGQDLVLADVASPHEEGFGREDEPPQEGQSSLVVSSAAEDECVALDHEDKPMNHELGNGDANSTSHVDQDQACDQETKEFLIRCRSDPNEVIKAEFEEKGDDLMEDAEKKEENEATDQNVLEKAIQLERETSATENGHETTEKCVIELQSSTQHLPNNTTEAETLPTSKETEPIGAQVEDKTARRSLSTCSNLRFPSTSVHTEFVGKPLQFQVVQIEEKTIRMERSNSATAPNSLNNKQEKTNAVTKETRENGSNASPSRDAAAAESPPKGNGRRKARSSLFTTCICCTAAIS